MPMSSPKITGMFGFSLFGMGADLMAIRLDHWKMHIGVKPEASWWDEKYYPSVPYIFNLRMDLMEKMDPQSHEWGTSGETFLAPSPGSQPVRVRSSRLT